MSHISTQSISGGHVPSGKVFLVGAGPGDPGLITVKGKECLESADVVIYDSLANEALLEYAPMAEKIFVGKRAQNHTLPQEDINRIIVEQAQKVSVVVRLKGGDPLIFGRGGEEALALVRHRVPFEIVPGVTSGIAAAAYAGIPLTMRGISSSFTLITGHGASHGQDDPVDISRIALQGTLLFYMGMKNLPGIVDQLQRIGRSPHTPVAVIQWATYPHQRALRGTLDTICDLCKQENIRPPAIIVVGDVVSLSEQLSWLEA